MITYSLDEMTRGWFVGSFSPTALETENVEVGVKRYVRGEKESRHFHKVATEVTLIVEGEAMMNSKIFRSGDIIRIPPGESTDFEALTDLITVVVKVPGAKNDKYLGDTSC